MDTITRYISDRGVRLSIAVTTETIDEARRRHDLWPVVSAALGRTMTGALLLVGDYKNNETVSIKIAGDGPIGALHVDALGDNHLRGYADNPHVDLPITEKGKLDVGAAVGHTGEIAVTRFTGMDRNYSSNAELVSGEIGDDLAYYLYISEQVPSTIAVGVLVDTDDSILAAGGFLVQALPGASEEDLERIADNIRNIGTLTDYLLDHKDAEGLAERIMEGVEYKSVYTGPVSFGCTCSRERFLGILKGLPPEDKAEILEDSETELVCHYCGEKYVFEQTELKTLFAK